MRVPRGYDTTAYAQRRNAAILQLPDQLLRDRIRKKLLFVSRRPIKHCPVFGDDTIQRFSVWKDLEHVRKMTTREQDHLTARRANSSDVLDHLLIYPSVFCQCSIIIGRDGDESHWIPLAPLRA